MSVPKRNVAPIKNPKHKYSVIILAAEIGTRTKSWGNKSLLPINNTTTLIQHQLTIINKVFSSPEIILVTGFEADKVMNNTPYGIIKIENEKYEETNGIRNLGLGLRACTTNKVIVINGDALFNEATLGNAKFSNKSVVLVDNKIKNNSEDVGCTIDNNKIEYMMYGLEHPWQHILYLTGDELKAIHNIAWNKNKANLFIWEAINHIILAGGQFTAQYPEEMRVLNIKSSTEIQKLKNAHSFYAH